MTRSSTRPIPNFETFFVNNLVQYFANHPKVKDFNDKTTRSLVGYENKKDDYQNNIKYLTRLLHEACDDMPSSERKNLYSAFDKLFNNEDPDLNLTEGERKQIYEKFSLRGDGTNKPLRAFVEQFKEELKNYDLNKIFTKAKTITSVTQNFGTTTTPPKEVNNEIAVNQALEIINLEAGGLKDQLNPLLEDVIKSGNLKKFIEAGNHLTDFYKSKSTDEKGSYWSGSKDLAKENLEKYLELIESVIEDSVANPEERANYKTLYYRIVRDNFLRSFNIDNEHIDYGRIANLFQKDQLTGKAVFSDNAEIKEYFTDLIKIYNEKIADNHRLLINRDKKNSYDFREAQKIIIEIISTKDEGLQNRSLDIDKIISNYICAFVAISDSTKLQQDVRDEFVSDAKLVDGYFSENPPTKLDAQEIVLLKQAREKVRTNQNLFKIQKKLDKLTNGLIEIEEFKEIEITPKVSDKFEEYLLDTIENIKHAEKNPFLRNFISKRNEAFLRKEEILKEIEKNPEQVQKYLDEYIKCLIVVDLTNQSLETESPLETNDIIKFDEVILGFRKIIDENTVDKIIRGVDKARDASYIRELYNKSLKSQDSKNIYPYPNEVEEALISSRKNRLKTDVIDTINNVEFSTKIWRGKAKTESKVLRGSKVGLPEFETEINLDSADKIAISFKKEGREELAPDDLYYGIERLASFLKISFPDRKTLGDESKDIKAFCQIAVALNAQDSLGEMLKSFGDEKDIEKRKEAFEEIVGKLKRFQFLDQKRDKTLEEDRELRTYDSAVIRTVESEFFYLFQKESDFKTVLLSESPKTKTINSKFNNEKLQGVFSAIIGKSLSAIERSKEIVEQDLVSNISHKSYDFYKKINQQSESISNRFQILGNDVISYVDNSGSNNAILKQKIEGDIKNIESRIERNSANAKKLIKNFYFYGSPKQRMSVELEDLKLVAKAIKENLYLLATEQENSFDSKIAIAIDKIAGKKDFQFELVGEFVNFIKDSYAFKERKKSGDLERKEGVRNRVKVLLNKMSEPEKFGFKEADSRWKAEFDSNIDGIAKESLKVCAEINDSKFKESLNKIVRISDKNAEGNLKKFADEIISNVISKSSIRLKPNTVFHKSSAQSLINNLPKIKPDETLKIGDKSFGYQAFHEEIKSEIKTPESYFKILQRIALDDVLEIFAKKNNRDKGELRHFVTNYIKNANDPEFAPKEEDSNIFKEINAEFKKRTLELGLSDEKTLSKGMSLSKFSEDLFSEFEENVKVDRVTINPYLIKEIEEKTQKSNEEKLAKIHAKTIGSR